MQQKYPLHMELVRAMLLTRIQKGVTESLQGDFFNLIDDLGDDGYLTRQDVLDLQAKVTEHQHG